jgi:uncharacterized protein DUF5694
MRPIERVFCRALLLLATTSGAAAAQVAPARCAAGTFEVMVLGTFHFAGSSDDFQRNVIDVLSPERQTELGQLAGRLARFAPQIVAVEYPSADRDTLTAWFERYRAKQARVSRNEIFQVGFRLAERVGLSTIAAVDYQMGLGNDSTGAFLARHPEVAAARDKRWEEISADMRAEDDLLKRSTLIDYFRHINSSDGAADANELMYRAIELGEGTNYGGPLMLARWYERNIRIVHNLLRARVPGKSRALLLIGAGHVRPLLQILGNTPGVCVVSPVPFLN